MILSNGRGCGAGKKGEKKMNRHPHRGGKKLTKPSSCLRGGGGGEVCTKEMRGLFEKGDLL